MTEMNANMDSNTNSLQRRKRTNRLTQKTKSPRIRSASVGRSRDYDLRCRYWAFLFDNLHRAVDEIYQNCEKDESIVECKEAIMALDNYKREFQALIQWLNLNMDFESTPPPNRPNSLAWEVRKSMPKQMTFWNTFFNRFAEKNINSKILDKNKDDFRLSEEKENIKSPVESNPVIVNDNVCDENTEESNDKFKPEIETDSKVENNSIVTEIEKTEKKSMNVDSCVTKSATQTTTSNCSVKPLNPLARSFKSRIHITPNTSSQTTVTKKTTTSKTVASVVANSISKSNLKRTVVSTPDLTLNSKESSEVKKTETKVLVSVMNKNFIKDTNSSRAKNVRNAINNQLSKSTIVLSTKNNLSKENVKQNNLNVSKNKKVKDADGWELVRGRQRYKASPPKVIILEDESIVKTTADGSVMAVTAWSQTTEDWDPMSPGMCSSWSSQTDTDQLRTPGRALQLHEKLSSPSRKRNSSPTESFKKHEQKLAKAKEARDRFLQKKAQNFKGIVKKVEEMKVRKEEQQLQLKISMEMKLQRAEEKRQQQLKRIVRKAHDEDSKVNEILFINSLEAQNKKYDILSKEKDCEMRLQDIQGERQRKLEEKAAKELAAEERRKLLEEERQQRIMELQERRKLKDMKIEQQLQEKEKERIEMATQKALDRRTRISAINAQFAANIEELQKKIQQKQDESKRRHEENMEQIRQKALESSVKKSSLLGNDDAPICVPYDTMKMCNICNVIIKSEVFLFGHLRGKKHYDAIIELNEGKVPSNEELENYNLKHIVEAPKDSETIIKSIVNCDNEKLKAVRKRSKKLKQKLLNKANQYESLWSEKLSDNKSIKTSNKVKIGKLFKELNQLSGDTQITGQWPTNMIHSLERILNEFEKLFKSNSTESLYFHSINGISLLTKMLSRILSGSNERPTSLTDRANSRLANIYEIVCVQHFDVSDYVLQSNNIIQLLDFISHRINLLDTNVNNCGSTSGPVVFDPVMGSLCRLMASIFSTLYDHYSIITNKTDDCLTFNQRIQDIISYVVSIGMIDKLSLFLSNICGPIDEMPELVGNLKNIISLLTSISKLMSLKNEIKFGSKLSEDETQFMITLRMTHVCGVVSLVYGMLLHSGAPARDDNAPPIAAKHTLELALESIQFINYVSLIDITMIQSILGGEGLSLQLRHICSYLMWYCSHHKSLELLNELILLIGNFVVLNHENQTLLQSGQRPTVLQQLCSLPFEYFCDKQLCQILFPTLISCCFKNIENRNILEQEMSTLMLSTFIESTIVSLQCKAVDTDFMSGPKTFALERWTFAVRFPKNRWNEAKDYFESQDM